MKRTSRNDTIALKRHEWWWSHAMEVASRAL
jgi:hypothetical protein